jgi:biopolymer transport protein ExbD
MDTGSMIVAGSEYSSSELIALVADELTRLDDDPTKLTVVLRVDREAESRTVSDVVEALASMDIRKVRFAVQVPE